MSSAEAARTRVRLSSCSMLVFSFLACEVFLQTVQAPLPEGAISFEPAGRGLQGRGVEADVVHPPFDAPPDQLRLFQHHEVLGYGVERHVVSTGEVADRGFAPAQARQD